MAFFAFHPVMGTTGRPRLPGPWASQRKSASHGARCITANTSRARLAVPADLACRDQLAEPHFECIAIGAGDRDELGDGQVVLFAQGFDHLAGELRQLILAGQSGPLVIEPRREGIRLLFEAIPDNTRFRTPVSPALANA
jgi:hypothetical protein